MDQQWVLHKEQVLEQVLHIRNRLHRREMTCDL